MTKTINKSSMKKIIRFLLLALVFISIFTSLSNTFFEKDNNSVTGNVAKKFVLTQSKSERIVNSVNAESVIKKQTEENESYKTIKVFNDKGDLLATNPTDIDALKTTSNIFNIEMGPTASSAIQNIQIEGISKENIDKDLVILSDVPTTNTNFAEFESLSSSAPLINFKSITLDYGYICAGPRYKIYKCVDWDYVNGICLNDSSWVAIRVLTAGLHRVKLTLTPEDPGIGIGPDPYGAVCGDRYCEGENYGESCTSCALDCGDCSAEKKVTFWSWLWNWLTGAVIVDTPITGKAILENSSMEIDNTETDNSEINNNETEINGIDNNEINNQEFDNTEIGNNDIGNNEIGTNEGLDIPTNNYCVEIWECGDWSPYSSDGFRERICIDKNKCGTTINQPPLQEKCEWMDYVEEPEIEERKLNPFRVIIATIIFLIIIYVIIMSIKLFNRMFKEIMSLKPKKPKKRKRRDRFEIIKERLTELSQEVKYTNNVEPVLDRLSEVIKEILKALLGTRQSLSFLNIEHLVSSGALRKSQKEKAINLIHDMEKARFSSEGVTREQMEEFIKRAKSLIPHEINDEEKLV